MGKVKDLARRMRGEFPPELLRELAATETGREPGPPENIYNRVTSKADAREMAREMAKMIDASNLPRLRSSPSPHLDRQNDQRHERVQDHGHYRDRHDRRDVHDRREGMERVTSARYRDELTPLRAGSEQYHSRYHAYDQHDGRQSDSRRSRSPRQHAQTYRARPPMRPSAEPKLSSRQINSERRVGPWQEWKADYTRRRYE
ncbi:uncharacterized protein J3D65DRAFT_609360 [Phyllosticta citribraziliensis]|uniref:Uncharacterized protein n=1 Tax=Phyllosticta citribraziliensis TaxID=989973 RepID=A0ABR1MA75_9PEZI